MDPKLIAKNAKAAMEALLATAKAEKRVLTDDEKTTFDTHMAEFDNAMAMIDAAEKLAVAAAPQADGLEASEIEAQKEPVPQFQDITHVMKIVNRVAKGQPTDEDRKILNATQGQNTTTPSEGGFVVGADVASGINQKINSSEVVAPDCTNQEIGANSNRYEWYETVESSRATGSRGGGLRGYWIAEGATITASRMKISKREINLGKVACLFYATGEMERDGVQMMSAVNRQVGSELAWLVDDAILATGSGAGQPRSVLNSPALVTVAKRGGQAASTVVAENIIDMYNRMNPASMMGAKWYISPDILPQLDTMAIAVGTGGVPVFMPPNGLSDAPYGTLRGRPIVPTEFNPTLGTKGDIIFANMSEYMKIEKGGVQAASSIHVEFLTDQNCYRFIRRVNGDTIWANTIASAKGATERSPYVTLAAR